MRSRITYLSQTSFYRSSMLTMFNQDTDVRRNVTNQYFFAYLSRYAGAFQILDSLKIPRPCAYKSFNLT